MRETLIKGFLGVIIFLLIATFIWRSGYAQAEEKYQEIIQTYNKKQLEKAASIEGAISEIRNNQAAFEANLSADMGQIRNGLKGKTLVVYKDGKCTPSKDFLDSRAQAIDRANHK